MPSQQQPKEKQQPTTVLVQNNEARLIMPTLMDEHGNGRVMVRAGGKEGLLPGINKVERAEWEKVAGTPFMAHYLSEEKVVVHEEMPDVPNMKVSKAVPVIKGTFEMSLLDQWETAERKGSRRRSVMEAIAAQRKVLDDAVKKD